jgi:hypothetical protein
MNLLMNFNIIEAWTKASEELGIKINTNQIIKLNNGKEFEFSLHIENFGGKLGTLLTGIDNSHLLNFTEFKSESYYLSCINEFSYEKFEKSLFIDTLNDWGWFGPEYEKPSWYTGKPWC